LAFPYDENFPASEAEFFEIAFVAFNISPAFVLPEFFVCCGFDSTVTAAVHMPETAVDKDYFFVPDHHKVRVTGQVTAMQGITKTYSMNDGTNSYFRRGIL